MDVASLGIDRDRVLRWAIAGVGGLGLGFVLMYVGGMASHIAAFRVLYSLRIKLSDHIGRLSLGFFNRNASGKIKKMMNVGRKNERSTPRKQMQINVAIRLRFLYTLNVIITEKRRHL